MALLSGLTVGGIVSKVLGNQMVTGVALGVILVIGIMLWVQGNQLERAEGYLAAVEAEVQTALDTDEDFKPKELAGEVRLIAEQRDVALREADNLQRTIEDQNAQITALYTQSQRNRAEADRLLAQVQRLTRERDQWIDRAEELSTRTQERSCKVELQETEDALDGLYYRGF